MKLFRLAMVATLTLSACDKPTAESCEQALRNIQHLIGTDTLNSDTAGLQSEVRRCRGGSSKESVECAIKAKTLDDLHACKFYAESPHAAGSGAGSAGSGH